MPSNKYRFKCIRAYTLLTLGTYMHCPEFQVGVKASTEARVLFELLFVILCILGQYYDYQLISAGSVEPRAAKARRSKAKGAGWASRRLDGQDDQISATR